MFTRAVEIQTKKGKARELSQTVNDKVLPLLRKQPGFVDEVILISTHDPDTMLALSFWNSRDDAERYHREQYPTVLETIEKLVDGEPEVRTFEVDYSTAHKISRGKAA